MPPNTDADEGGMVNANAPIAEVKGWYWEEHFCNAEPRQRPVASFRDAIDRVMEKYPL